jgi:hypothetical protein
VLQVIRGTGILVLYMDVNVRSYLPSKAFIKKVIILVALVLIIVVISEIAKYISKRQEARKESQVAVADTATPLVVRDVATIVTNEDGIPDWQSNIYNAIGVRPPTSASTSLVSNNQTDLFAQDLLTTAATVSQSGSLTDEGASNIADKVTDQIANQPLATDFTMSDIKTVPDNDASRKAYVASLNTLLNTTYPLDIDTSASILQDALDANDETVLNKLDPIQTRYTKLIAAMKALPVPQSAAGGAVEFLNRLNRTLATIQLMRTTFTNPITAISAMMQYAQTISDLIEYLSPFTGKLPYANIATDVSDPSAPIDTSSGY